MTVQEAIQKRRAYRSLTKVKIPASTIRTLAQAAQLCCSAENHQPWRFVFVTDPAAIAKISQSYISDNAWADNASMLVAVCTEPSLDVTVTDKDIAPQVPHAGKLARKGNVRPYSYFDTGMATGFLILRATELGLVAHPIAGYLEQRVQAILDIPADLTVMALVVVGRRSATIDPNLPPEMKADEKRRPARLPLSQIAHVNRWTGKVEPAARRKILEAG
jgi:nitroreductase